MMKMRLRIQDRVEFSSNYTCIFQQQFEDTTPKGNECCKSLFQSNPSFKSNVMWHWNSVHEVKVILGNREEKRRESSGLYCNQFECWDQKRSSTPIGQYQLWVKWEFESILQWNWNYQKKSFLNPLLSSLPPLLQVCQLLGWSEWSVDDESISLVDKSLSPSIKTYPFPLHLDLSLNQIQIQRVGWWM